MTTMNTWIKRTLAATAVATTAMIAGGPNADAASTTGNFTVSTQVTGSCTVSVLPLTFPNYTTGQLTTVDGQTTATVSCPGASAASPLAADLRFSTVSNTYAMTSGANNLNYAFYSDAARASSIAINTDVGISINDPAFSYVIYGSILGGQTVPTGAYAQVVTATLTY